MKLLVLIVAAAITLVSFVNSLVGKAIVSRTELESHRWWTRPLKQVSRFGWCLLFAQIVLLGVLITASNITLLQARHDQTKAAEDKIAAHQDRRNAATDRQFATEERKVSERERFAAESERRRLRSMAEIEAWRASVQVHVDNFTNTSQVNQEEVVLIYYQLVQEGVFNGQNAIKPDYHALIDQLWDLVERHAHAWIVVRTELNSPDPKVIVDKLLVDRYDKIVQELELLKKKEHADHTDLQTAYLLVIELFRRAPLWPDASLKSTYANLVKDMLESSKTRFWTLLDGRTLEGQFLGISESNVVVRSSSGSVESVPIQNLSVEDKAFLAREQSFD